MAEKKYYWIKLKRDFFKRHDIKIVEAMPNGKDYILFYLKLLLESIDHKGELRFSDTIPYNEQMLSVITGTNVDIVKAAMEVFIGLNMIEMLDDGTIYMSETEKLIDGETASAKRVRDHREKQRALQCNTNVTKCNTEKEIDIEKDIEKDIELEKESELELESRAASQPARSLPPDEPKQKSKRFVKPTLEEVKQFCADNGYDLDVDYWYDYYESNGWKVGKNAMKDWKAAVRNWTRRNIESKTTAIPKKESKMDILKRMYKEALDDENGNNSNNNSN